MNSKGYIKINRKVLSLDIWRDPYDCRLFFYCLLWASHNHYKGLKPGQMFYTVQSLASALAWSRNSVAKHIRTLSQAGLIVVEHTLEGSVMTILNWEELTGEMIKKEVDNSLSASEPSAQMLCMNAQQLTEDAQQECVECTPIEHNQNRYQKETKTLSERERERAREFEKWWERYPRHERKNAARKAWMNLINVPVETLTRALEKAKSSPQWSSSNGRFIPSAAKWLDGKWEDYTERESEASGEWMEY